MLDISAWTDPAVIAAVSALSAAIGATGSKLLDSWGARDKRRLDSEDSARDDLLALVRFQGEEIVKLHQELTATRRELREFSDLHQRAIGEWQDRYGTIYSELLELRARLGRASIA